jgi:transposase
MNLERAEIARLKREVIKLKAERDIQKICHGPLLACAR